ncbi:MAG: FAD/NAD(P)-binding protein [Acidobacteriota bacterium]
MNDTRRITIIGGGASGTLLAVNLLQQSGDRPVSIDLIEKRERVGRGVAFSTADECHLLNVPAAKMGAFPDDIEHFHGWLGENNFEYAPSDFVPRKLFGRYLTEVFESAVNTNPSGSTFRLHNDEAVDIDLDSQPANVKLASGSEIPPDKVVLAFGNFLPPHPSVANLDFVSAPKYFQDPWSAKVATEIAPDDTVLIIGTGLSMVDFLMRYHRSKHRGKIYAISTRGLLPAVHKLGYAYDSFIDEIRPMTRITDILKAVRRHVASASADSSDWRAVIDSLRPHTQEIWLNLPTAEKKYFMQHLSRYWNVSRHRMPAEAAAVVDEMQATGRLAVMKGRLKTIDWNGGKFNVGFASNGEIGGVETNAVINCIGSESNFERLDSPLVKNLFAGGHIRNDSLSLGLDAAPDGTIIDRNGSPSDRLFTLGTALKGVLWESTAIPEIRVQARALAEKLLAS